ncbi:alginate lyase family protein [Phyllobacterium leguminum]|uniref:alginate lyase family protein n=1 Tax=Phyllobacterium leguminum TaxID=314237 RepID=UPI000DA266E0
MRCDRTARPDLPRRGLRHDRTRWIAARIGAGKKAREYHLFALNALMPTAAFAEANGIPAYNVCNGALRRIVQFTLRSYATQRPSPPLRAKRRARPYRFPEGGSFNILRLNDTAFCRIKTERNVSCPNPLSKTIPPGSKRAFRPRSTIKCNARRACAA